MDPYSMGAAAGLGAISGWFGNEAKKSQQKREADLRAAEIRASPWTHMAPSTSINFNGQTGLGAALGGGTAGLQSLQGLSPLFGGGKKTPWTLMGADKIPGSTETGAALGGGYNDNGMQTDMFGNPLFKSYA